MAEPHKPAWDDPRRMPIWVNAMLDAELEVAIAATFTPEGIEALATLAEPLPALLDHLSNGTATPAQQARAAQIIAQSQQQRRSGPKPKPPLERDALRAMAARDSRRIMALWREHYGRTDLERAVDLACRRWLDRQDYADADSFEEAMLALADKVHDTLRRAKGRNFGAV